MEQRRARNWPRVVLGVLCVVLLVGVAFRLIQESTVNKELEAFQAKYRALGYPVTLEELKERHEVPEGEENAAPLILAALDRIDDSDVDMTTFRSWANTMRTCSLANPCPSTWPRKVSTFCPSTKNPSANYAI